MHFKIMLFLAHICLFYFTQYMTLEDQWLNTVKNINWIQKEKEGMLQIL